MVVKWIGGYFFLIFCLNVNKDRLVVLGGEGGDFVVWGEDGISLGYM